MPNASPIQAPTLPLLYDGQRQAPPPFKTVAMKADGIYKGRKKAVDDEEIRRRIAAGASKTDVARELKVPRMTIYRALGK